MNKMSKSLSCSLAAIFSLSIAVISPKVGPFGVDTVSAASNWVAPAPTTPNKPTTPSKKPTTPVTYAPATSVNRLLRFNSMGADVKLLQTTINTKGYKLVVDGIFGNLTLAAVKDYQGKNSLAVDGLVGPLTLAKLNAKPVTPPAVKPPVVVPPVVVPPVVVPPVDVVTTASLVNNVASFEKSIGKDGTWIISTVKDLTSTNNLVLEGEFKNGKKDAISGADLIQRKIALYTQDDKRVVTARFTLTAPRLTIMSPMASLEHGTFKGDIYVSAANFKLIDQVVVGNIYFTTQIAKDTFNQDTKSSVTGVQELIQVDAVTSPSLVKDIAAFENAISTKGNWIASVSKDLTTTKELVVDGDKMNTKTPPVSMRKIALYSQDDKYNVTRRFTLTAPKLTIKSIDASIQKGTFVGNIFVSAKNFKLIDTKVIGSVYFTTQEAKDTFDMDAKSSITKNKELIQLDAVTSASLVKDVAAFENAISTNGNWIASVAKDLTTTKELVLEGDKMNTKTPPVSMRKIALYSQDDKYVTTRKFTLTAPKLTIKSIDANISKGIFVGDIYVSAKNFQLIDTAVVGNLYFTTQEAKDTFKLDAKSSVSGLQELKLN